MEDNQNKITDEALELLSDATRIEKMKLKYFIEKYGLKEILEKPWIMDITDEQMNLIACLKSLINSSN